MRALLLNLLMVAVPAQLTAAPRQVPVQIDADGMSTEEKLELAATKDRIRALTRKTRADIAAVHNDKRISATERHVAVKKIRHDAARQRKSLLDRLRKNSEGRTKKSH